MNYAVLIDEKSFKLIYGHDSIATLLYNKEDAHLFETESEARLFLWKQRSREVWFVQGIDSMWDFPFNFRVLFSDTVFSGGFLEPVSTQN